MFDTIAEFAHMRFGFSSEWLQEHSQLTGFNRMIASCLPKMAAKSKRGLNKANFVQQSNRIAVIQVGLCSGNVDTIIKLLYKCVRPGFRIVSSIFKENGHPWNRNWK